MNPPMLAEETGRAVTAALVSVDAHALPRQEHGHKRRQTLRRQRAQHDDDVEQRQRPRVRLEIRPPAVHPFVAQRALRMQELQRVRQRQPDPAARSATTTAGRARPRPGRTPAARSTMPERSAGDVQRHRKPLAMVRHGVHERRGGRMKRSAAEAANEENGRQHCTSTSRCRSRSARPPPAAVRRGAAAVGRQRSARAPNPSCETDVRHLKADGERARHEERQPEASESAAGAAARTDCRTRRR